MIVMTMPDAECLRREGDRLIGELVAEIRQLRREMDALRKDVTELTALKNRGWGMATILLLLAGGAGALLNRLVGHW